MSCSAHSQEKVILDWPATWDKVISYSDDPKWVRFMRRLWLARWPVVLRVLRNRFDQAGPSAVKQMLPRLLSSTTAIQAATLLATRMPEEILASAFEERHEELPAPVMVIDCPLTGVPEGYIPISENVDGDWMCASFDDCAICAGRCLIAVLVDHIAGELIV